MAPLTDPHEAQGAAAVYVRSSTSLFCRRQHDYDSRGRSTGLFFMDKLSPEHRGWLMSRVGTKNTAPEVAVRQLLFAMGFRYRLHDKHLPGRPDIVFRGRRKAIFVNGCFWHGHKGCRYGVMPKSRVEFWTEKISRNRIRDQQNDERLHGAGWRSLTVWECELKDVEALARKLVGFLEDE